MLPAYLLIGSFVALFGYSVLRKIIHEFVPSFVPGESNAILLVTPIVAGTHRKEDGSINLNGVKEYDYIIVGGGTAACVLANRLSEDPNVTVLMIEAGFSDVKQIMSRVPAGFPKLFKTVADWDIATSKEKELNGREMQWPRGKMLGGCSSINAMIYTRCSPDDYDEWESKYGCEGWGWKDMEPMFKKSEGYIPSPDHPVDPKDHNENGPWKIRYAYFSSFNRLVLDAFELIGIKKVADFNTSKGVLGASQFQSFIDQEGRRSSMATAFLSKEVVSRPNLSILVGQTVTKVVVEEKEGKLVATGVEMGSSSISPARYLAKSKREVILAAGAVHSPHILMHSGLGPAEHLKQVGIKVVKDIPQIGKNLIDHLSFGINLKLKPGSSCQYLSGPLASLPCFFKWLVKDPTLTFFMSSIAEVGSFLRAVDRKDCPKSVKDLTSGKNSADLELIGAPVAFIEHGQVDPPSGDYGTIGAVLLRPESRGNIQLKDNNPFTPPLVNANYLSTESDKQLAIYGMRLSLKVAEQTPIKDIQTGWFRPERATELNDQELFEVIRDCAETLYHPVGTVRMGREKEAVLDNRLRVYGVEGLRVCDASIMPDIVAGHTCAPTVAIAERLACLIKEGK